MQEIEGNNILKMATWLRFLWQPRTQTADKQTIMTERKREREGASLMFVMIKTPSRPLMALKQDGHSTDVISRCKARSALAFGRAAVRGDGMPLKPYWWNPEQKNLMWGVNEWRSWPIWAQLETVSSGPAAVTEYSHRHGQQRWEMGKCQNNLWICNEWRPNCEWIIQLWTNVTTNRRPGSFIFWVAS